MQPAMSYRVVQRWNKGQQNTVQSEHATIADAFAALDRISGNMARTGAPSDAIELIVLDEQGHVVPRPATH